MLTGGKCGAIVMSRRRRPKFAVARSAVGKRALDLHLHQDQLSHPLSSNRNPTNQQQQQQTRSPGNKRQPAAPAQCDKQTHGRPPSCRRRAHQAARRGGHLVSVFVPTLSSVGQDKRKRSRSIFDQRRRLFDCAINKQQITGRKRTSFGRDTKATRASKRPSSAWLGRAGCPGRRANRTLQTFSLASTSRSEYAPQHSAHLAVDQLRPDC